MRILLADHHAEPCLALRTLLEEQPGLDLIGEAVDAQGLLKLAEKQTADLILLDGKLPGLSIDDLIAKLRALEPRPVVVWMSSEFEGSKVLLKCGVDAFVCKADGPDKLLKMLRQYAKQTSIKEDANINKVP